MAALILLGLVLANALLHLRAPFSWVWVVLAARATQLTFVYQRLRCDIKSPSTTSHR